MAKSKHPHAAATEAPSGGSGDILPATWAALAIYLVLFYLWPMGSGAGESQATLRRGHALVSLLLGDEIVASWIDGCTWHSLAERGQLLAVAAAIFATVTAAGWVCLCLSGIGRVMTRLERFVFAAGVGLQLVSLVTLALGLAGLLRVELFAALALAALVLAAALLWRRPSTRLTNDPDAAGAKVASSPDVTLQLNRNWLWLGVPFVIVLLLGAMLPPVEFDVREYHLQAPKEFFQSGQITFLAHNVYANMPLGAEMLSLAGMVVCGDWHSGALVGKTLIACYAPLTALGLLAAGRRLASPAAAIIAALAYISIPWIALVSVQGLIEGAVAFYLFAALYAALVWQRNRTAGRSSFGLLGLAGFLAGAAVSCKYPSAVFCVVPLSAWIAWAGLESAFLRPSTNASRAGWATAVIPLAVFLSACTLSCGLWLAKNALLAGNPVYPLLYDWFDGLTRSVAKNDQWMRVHRPPHYDLVDLTRRIAGVMLTSVWISPLVVPLAVLALTTRRTQPLVRGLAIYFVYVLAAWWLFTHRIDRFWVPVLPVAALLAGIGATWAGTRAWRITLAGLLAFGLVSNFAIITSGVMGENHYLAELDTLRRDSPHIDPWHLYLNDHKDEVTRVLLVADAQPFDLEVPVLYNTVFDDSIFEQLARDKTDRQVRMALADHDISHIYVAWSEVARYRSPGNYGFTKFVTRKVFDDLVEAGVLQELPKIKDHPGQMFRVVPLRGALILPNRPVFNRL